MSDIDTADRHDHPESVSGRRSGPSRFPHLGLWTGRAVLLLIVEWAVFRAAWFGDDCLITLRTALNLTHGWGWGFNATEAVQGYTHPLWFLVWSAIGATTNQWIAGIMWFSIACSVGAIAIVITRTRSLTLSVVAVAALLGSNAFFDYTTSGLENPLAYLLVGLFAVWCLRWIGADPPGPTDDEVPVDRSNPAVAGTGSWVGLGLVVAALSLTRLDLIILVVPPLALLIWRLRSMWRTLLPRYLAATATVVIVAGSWFTWARHVYGTWLPNTYLAKQNSDIELISKMRRGAVYIIFSMARDPVTAVVLLGGILLIIRWGRSTERALLLGVLAYLAYTVFIGGDFMVGRFLAVPLYLVVLVALSITNRSMEDGSVSLLRTVRDRPNTTLLVVVLSLASLVVVGRLLPVGTQAAVVPTAVEPDLPMRWLVSQSRGGIADERGYYRAYRDAATPKGETSAGAPFVPMPVADIRRAPTSSSEARLRVAQLSDAARSWPENVSGRSLRVPAEVRVACGELGVKGILTGPEIHWIDPCGLTDRFIAATPYATNGRQWRTGHLERPLPAGYVEAIRTNDPSAVTDPRLRAKLAELWRTIR